MRMRIRTTPHSHSVSPSDSDYICVMSGLTGKVLKSTGKWYQVLLSDGRQVDARIRGKLRLEGYKTTNPLAVGDVVLLSDQFDEEGKAVIEDYELRQNYIVRKSTNLSKQ